MQNSLKTPLKLPKFLEIVSTVIFAISSPPSLDADLVDKPEEVEIVGQKVVMTVLTAARARTVIDGPERCLFQPYCRRHQIGINIYTQARVSRGLPEAHPILPTLSRLSQHSQRQRERDFG